MTGSPPGPDVLGRDFLLHKFYFLFTCSPLRLAVSVITEMEVEYGLARNRGLVPRVREAVRTLLNSISVLPFEREDARVAAQLRANLNSQGAPIGAYDLLLAACALRRGLKIVTHNAREFVRISGLGLEDWSGK